MQKHTTSIKKQKMFYIQLLQAIGETLDERERAILDEKPENTITCLILSHLDGIMLCH